MTAVLRAPLLPAAAAAVCIALAVQLSPLGGIALAVLLAGVFAVLAVASADRARRLCWCAAALVAGVSAVAALFGPLPGFDLRHAGPLDGLREALADPLRRLVPEPEGGIVRGIVLGERAAVDADLLATAFARSGTSHLLAISGFNMTLVATAVALLARGRLRPAITAALTVSCVLAYSVLVGLAPSVARAAVMAVVASLGLAFGRRPATDNALALAVATMVGIDASAIGDVGFLLSATATGGLLYLGDPMSRRLVLLPGAIRQGLATTLAATLPTIPIIAAVFGRVSLVSPLANLIAVPLFPPLMLAGAATAALGVVSRDLAQVPGLLAYALAFLLRIVVETSAALPLASLAVPDGPLAGLGYGALVAVAIFAGPAVMTRLASAIRWRVRRPGVPRLGIVWRPDLARRALWSSVALVLLLVVGIAVAVLWPASSGMRVRALDVGQGDAYLVEFDGRTLLVDGGPDPARLLAELGASLPPWHRRIDVIALTHAHADHADGLLGVLDRYEVGLAIEPVGLNPGTVATAWGARIARANVPRRAVSAGTRMRVGDATLAVLAPDGDPRVDVPSLVLRLERGSFSMLFMGDATEQAQADLLLSPELLGARVYVPPHHGAASAYAVRLVDAVRPSAAVISVGAQNRYGHPTPETLAALGRVPTYRTDRDGTVELDQSGNSQLVIRTHANGLPPPRRGSLPYAPPAR